MALRTDPTESVPVDHRSASPVVVVGGTSPGTGAHGVLRVVMVGAHLAVGAAIATIGTYAHLVVLGGRRLPVGLVLAILMLVAAVVTIRALGAGTVNRVAMAVGWWGWVLLVGSTPRREGDVLMVTTTTSVLWLLLGSVTLALMVLVPSPRRRPGRRGRRVR